MYTGSCLCKSVRYEVSGELGDFGFCHCRSCQKASGSAHAANAPVDRARFRLLGGAETLREYESPGKRRVFCSTCGAPLYAYLTTQPEVIRLRLGSLDTPFTGQPRAHTFVAERAPWAPPITDDVPQFEGWAARAVLNQRGSKQPAEAGPATPVGGAASKP
jgi:hypothetical protein